MYLVSSDVLKIIRNVVEVHVNVYNSEIRVILSPWMCNKRGIEFVYCYPYLSVPNIHENVLLFIQ